MKQRVLTALLLLAVVLSALFFDPFPQSPVALLLLIVMTGAVLYEAGAIVAKIPAQGGIPGPASRIFFTLTALSIGVTLSLGIFRPNSVPILAAGVATLFFKRALWQGNARPQSVTMWSVILPIYLILACATTGLLIIQAPKGTFPMLLVAAIPVWAGDTAAIFAGKALGKNPLAPSISPQKTWEGAFFNLLFATAAGALVGGLALSNPLFGTVWGITAGITGQLGDLAQSALKRQANLKDSSRLLPGHGGVFDRVDSLLASLPFFMILERYFHP